MSRQWQDILMEYKCCAIDIETFKNLSQCCKTSHAPAFSSGFFIIKIVPSDTENKISYSS